MASKNIALGKRVQVGLKCSNVDAKYGPYASRADAFAKLGEDGMDCICQGLTVGIIVDSKIVEYWWKDASNLTLSGLVQKITDGGGSVPEELQEEVDALMAEVFPLKVSVASSNAGTFEEGTAVTPTMTLAITRQSKDVSSSASVVADPSTATISEDKKTITAAAAVSTGSTSLKATVTQGGQTASQVSKSWSWTNYRYYGVLDSAPADATAIVSLIEACNTDAEGNTLKKELSTVSTLGSTPLASGKYYLFAVKGTPTLVCHHAETGGTISATTGTIDAVPQANDSSKTNKYSYIIVPASASAWNFTIKNS